MSLVIFWLYLIIILQTYNQLSAPVQNALFNWLNAARHFWRAPSVGHVTGQEPIRDLAEILTMQMRFRKSSIMFSPKSPSNHCLSVFIISPSLFLSLFTIKSTDSCKHLVANSFLRRQMWIFFFLDVCACVWVSRLLMLQKSYTTIVAPRVSPSAPIPHDLRRLLPHLPHARMPFTQAWLPAHSKGARGFRPFMCFTFSKIFIDFCRHTCSCCVCVSGGFKVILSGPAK